MPHREEARKARREQFAVMAGLISLLGLVVVFAGYSLIGAQLEHQNGKNDFLKSEITILDKQLDQIKRLREQTQALLARKRVIEDLQRDRGETVHLLSELVRQVPEGVYLKSLRQDGMGVNITGYAQSNARVSALMRNIDASEWMERPRLIETKAVVLNGRRVNEFGMDFVLSRATPEEGGQ
ncbi:type IV pilus assembly protein PilN [Azonexus fungiphilus]|uniref:Type IV pilus assembly protein PilN n=1 Tax=Azonexus fungiphilus TaxID=146940 RepID=A0A495WD21_9RHOO|nr:type IV pilus assembly protein PilN [Azonexus fungiphilus]